MSKKLFMLLALMLVGALLLVACGGQATEEPTEAAVVEPTAAPTEAPTEAPTMAPTEEPTEVPAVVPTEEPTAVPTPEVSITVWADDTRAPILQALAEDFTAEYGIGLVVEQVADINDQLPIAVPAGEGPDIWIGPHDRLGGWYDSGLVAPIDLGAKVSQFVPVALEAMTFDGETYGMPYATENMALFRNTDLVPDAPATWEDMLAACDELKAAGTIEYCFALEGNGYKIYPIITSFGGYVFGKDDQGNWNASDLGVDSEGMVAAGDWIQEQIAAGYLPNSTDAEIPVNLFETGQVPFVIDGPWNLPRYKDSGIPYAISSFPSDGAPFGGVQGFYINALSENILLAQALLTELVATDEIMGQLYEAGGRPSAWLPTLEATEDPDLAAFGEAGTNASLMPAIPEMGSVWGSWNDAVVLTITGEDTPANAFTTAAEQIRTILAGAFAGMVNVPGSYQAAVGCDADWDPACEVTALVEGADGLYTASHQLAAGDYEGKVALDGSWTTNYGVDGEQDGANYAFTMAADGTVTFSYDPETHILTITTE
jgi:maltose-binding protein MalE